jgi:hypothetical protein
MQNVVASSEPIVPFQTCSIQTCSISFTTMPSCGDLSACDGGLPLTIDPDRLRQAIFEIAAQNVSERNRDALSELAKW